MEEYVSLAWEIFFNIIGENFVDVGFFDIEMDWLAFIQWQGFVFNVSLSLSGGNEWIKYFFLVGYYKENVIF